MSDVFISHAAEDGPIALDIADSLEQLGYTTWVYESDSAGGVSYLSEIDEELEQTQAVVLLISDASLRSLQVTKEIVRAHESGKPFIPVRCGVEHEQIQRKGEWRMALGAAVSVPLPADGVGPLIPRLNRSLERLGVQPTGMPGTRKQSGVVPPRPRSVGRPMPDAVRKVPVPVVVALVVGAVGALFNLLNVMQTLSPSDPTVLGLYTVAPFFRMNNLLVNVAGLGLNGAIIAGAWRVYRGDLSARQLVGRCAFYLLVLIGAWYLLTLLATMMTGALAGNRGALIGTSTSAAIIAAIQAGLVYLLFRERVAA
ncbi:MAG TPA: toll/interleukin-1 receptor domain-containing protein [Gemmatimonadaceae bacterium]|nr:toll/interleukin-1 receptor domain-containing protein [Gemmatimonadaceae bacterium]